MTRDLGSIVIALFGACCMANSGPARPVRPDMATLDGYVAELDGRPLPSASVQEVPSGCHVVGTPEEWGESDKSMSLTAKTGKVLFAIPMRGGHH